VERVEVDGLAIAYERAGTGAPVVLLHGYVGDGPSVWRHQIDALSEEYTVVAWDAPGAGGSSDPPETFGIDGYAACLAGFMDVLQLGPAHIIGLSFGGALGIALQRHHRSLTRSLVLASAYAGWRGSLDGEVAEQRLTQAYRLSERPPRDVVEALLPTMFALPVPEADVNAFRAAVEAVHPAGFRAMASASAEDLRDVPPTIDVPTLLIYGDKDERAPLPVAQQLQATIAGARLVTLSGAGHVCNVELPERFNDEVRQFLAAVGEPGGVRP
jgi:pimeloyl-ACP methyl ester carboxylesterase